jgi:hypothetical protein
VGFQIVTSGDKIAVDYTQNENGAFATSAIATTTASVTRAADVATVAGSANGISGTAGTFVVEVQLNATIAVDRVLDLGVNRPIFYNNSNTLTFFDGTNAAQGPLTPIFSAVNKLARAYSGVTATGSANGGAIVSGTFDGNFDVGTLTILGGSGAPIGSNWMRRILYFNQRLPDARLRGLTQ